MRTQITQIMIMSAAYVVNKKTLVFSERHKQRRFQLDSVCVCACVCVRFLYCCKYSNKRVVLYTTKYIINDLFPGKLRYSCETANPSIIPVAIAIINCLLQNAFIVDTRKLRL